MKIKKIYIKKLLSKKDIVWDLNPKVNVLVGENGIGKSTILSIMFNLLTNDFDTKTNSRFDFAQIKFDDENVTSVSRQNNFEIKDLTKSEYFKRYYKNYILDLKNSVRKETFRLYSEKNKDSEKNLDNELLEKVIDNVITEKMTTDAINELFVLNLIKTNEKNKRFEEIFLNERFMMPHNRQTLEKINVKLISMSQLNAHAGFEFKGSSQKMVNILELESDTLISEFNEKAPSDSKEKLTEVINKFFNLINKKVGFEGNKFVYLDLDIDKELSFYELSSGEQQLVYILFQVAISSLDLEKYPIILMDEPEVSLHLEWQDILIKQLTTLHPKAQFIIVTHSPAIIMNGWNDIYTDIEEISKLRIGEPHE